MYETNSFLKVSVLEIRKLNHALDKQLVRIHEQRRHRRTIKVSSPQPSILSRSSKCMKTCSFLKSYVFEVIRRKHALSKQDVRLLMKSNVSKAG